MDERQCIRGCTYQDTGNPREALDGALLCARCLRRLRNTLNEAPDLCAHLRSQIDPMKSGWNFDREKTGGRPDSGSRPPMSDDLVDAADEVLAILTYFAELFGDSMVYRTHTFDAGTDAVGAYHRARMPAVFLLENLPEIANDARVDGFARAVIDIPKDDEPGEEIQWTIAKALRRWSMHEASRWAKQPCPVCEQRTVRVRPPRVFGEAPLFWCVSEACTFDPAGELHVWGEYFGLIWHEHRWAHMPEDREGEYRCDCGARGMDAGDGTPEIRVVEEPPAPVAEPHVAEPTPVKVGRAGGSLADLDVVALDRDAARRVCPVCNLVRPCGCDDTTEGAAA